MDRRRYIPMALGAKALSVLVLVAGLGIAQERAPLAVPRRAAKAGAPVVAVQHLESTPYLPPASGPGEPIGPGELIGPGTPVGPGVAAPESIVYGEVVQEGGHCAACETKKPRSQTLYVFGDALYLTVRGGDLPFAQPRDGVGALAVPRGPVGIVDPDFSPGFRVGAGVALGEGSAIQGSFTWWENSSNETITAAPGTVLRSLVVFPATLNAAADSQLARSRQDFNLRLGDLDYRHVLCQGSNYYLGYNVGARYAHLTQDSRSEFSILGATTVDTAINFNGVGGRAGVEGEYRIRGGFYTFGKGAISLVGGHFGSSFTQRNVFAGLQANTSASEDRVVPILDFEVGAGWATSNGRIRVQGGYFLSSWHNTLTTTSLIQGVQGTNFTTNTDNFRDTLTFDGWSLRLEFRY